MSLQAMLNEQMNVLQKSFGEKVDGVAAWRWSVRLSDVPCAIQPLSASKREQYLRMQLNPSDVVYHARDTVLSAKDRLQIGGAHYDVLSTEQSRRDNWPSKAIVFAVPDQAAQEVAYP